MRVKRQLGFVDDLEDLSLTPQGIWGQNIFCPCPQVSVHGLGLSILLVLCFEYISVVHLLQNLPCNCCRNICNCLPLSIFCVVTLLLLSVLLPGCSSWFKRTLAAEVRTSEDKLWFVGCFKNRSIGPTALDGRGKTEGYFHQNPQLSREQIY